MRTGIWSRNFVCGWFDEKDYFEFRPADVVLKMEKVNGSGMRKYTRRFQWLFGKMHLVFGLRRSGGNGSLSICFAWDVFLWVPNIVQPRYSRLDR
ncbi:MAG: hypothetical protein ACE5K3_02750 [bacterium]